MQSLERKQILPVGSVYKPNCLQYLYKNTTKHMCVWTWQIHELYTWGQEWINSSAKFKTVCTWFIEVKTAYTIFIEVMTVNAWGHWV